MDRNTERPPSERERRPEDLQHVMIIMDGNGRWASRLGLPRPVGHRVGVRALRRIVERCIACDIEALTVFAFSSENRQRPYSEVSLLFDLFAQALSEHIRPLHAAGVRLRFIGERSIFPARLQREMEEAEATTRANTRLQLSVAVNYGGRWDVTRACRKLAKQVRVGALDPERIDEDRVRRQICLGDLPEPDLLIRTGGERRLSNYLLWQIAYTEIYFTDCLWPDFTPDRFETALSWYAGRQRRFGCIDERLLRDDSA